MIRSRQTTRPFCDPGRAGVLARPQGGAASAGAAWLERLAAVTAAAPAAVAEWSRAERGEFVSGGRNPLVQAAVPLLVLAGRLRGQIANADVESVRRQCIQEIRAFEDRVRQANVPSEDVLAARYALCTVIDEAVLNTPWGAQSGWAGQSLLVTFHREAQGGEKFFQILDRLLTEPQRYLGIARAVLRLSGGRDLKGGTGSMSGAPSAWPTSAAICTSASSGSAERLEPDLAPHWKGVQDRRNAVVRSDSLVGRGGRLSRRVDRDLDLAQLAPQHSRGSHQCNAGECRPGPSAGACASYRTPERTGRIPGPADQLAGSSPCRSRAIAR